MIKRRYQTAIELYPYQRSEDQGASQPVHHPVVIVGGGPIGLALALDLGQRGVPVVLLDDHDGVGLGSRAICFAKRTLEICDRLGCADPMLDKGVVWNKGRIFRNEREIYNFDLLPEEGHKHPAFINLQQPYFEQFLFGGIERAKADGAPIDVRGLNAVSSVRPSTSHVALTIETPEGPYQLTTDWLVACDGARSPVRDMMGLGFSGRIFEDNFLIADVKMKADFPTERWFWFDPPFNPDQSVLLHKQPDDIWRIDFQLGWNIDRDEVVKPENVAPRVEAMLGPDVAFDLDWVSVYTFQCCSMDDYRHDRVLFAGDSAHQVSPFGARGANGGMQDADNLGWKLQLVIAGLAPDALLDSYHFERKLAAEDNIKNSSQATDFLTPKSSVSRLFRDAVLDLAEASPLGRPLLNSGRLSTPTTYDGSPLNGPSDQGLPPRTRPGSPALDAPCDAGWFLSVLQEGFYLIGFDADLPQAIETDLPLTQQVIKTAGYEHLRERYLGTASSAIYLIRPDQHIAARWRAADAASIVQALNRAAGRAG